MYVDLPYLKPANFLQILNINKVSNHFPMSHPWILVVSRKSGDGRETTNKALIRL